MPKLNIPMVELASQKSSDPRVGHILSSGLSTNDIPAVALIGFPCELGIKINRGRLGAAQGPAAIRKCFYHLTPDCRDATSFSDLIARTRDYGDVVCTEDLSQAQSALGEAVSAALGAEMLPIVIGGGHEATLGHFLGYVAVKKPVHLINLDAHADVRESVSGQAHSGNSFRVALEHSSKLTRGYSVLGLQPQSCAKVHRDYLATNKAAVTWIDEITDDKIATFFTELRQDSLVSIDMDAMDQAFAPGVSSPASGGLTPQQLFHFAYHAGRTPAVCSLDIVETNPKFDRDDQTSRLAAMAVWHFLRGFNHRIAQA